MDTDAVKRWWVYSGELHLTERPDSDAERLYWEVVPAADLERIEAENEQLRVRLERAEAELDILCRPTDEGDCPRWAT